MKNTNENNKLIAQFMHLELISNKEYEIKRRDMIKQDIAYDLPLTLDDLKYHSSWDWLMPVVDKIESLGYEVQIRNTDCIIFQLLDTIKYKPIVDISSRNGKKDSTYKAVVKFIKDQNK